MKEKISSIVDWCKQRIERIVSIILIISVIILIFFIPSNQVRHEKIDYNVNIWQESFDLTRIPNGMVIWKHGVPGTEAEFIHADSTVRYLFFDVGILTRDNIVHRIRIPYYIMGTIKLGFFTKFREEPKKNGLFRNPNNSSYVYDDNEVKKLVNI